MTEHLQILLIEDEATDIELFTLAFQRIDARVRVSSVANVQSGQDYILGGGQYGDRQKYPFPDVIVLALLLPGISGVDFLKWCRATKVCKHIPLVVLTGAMQGEKAVQQAVQYVPADRLYFKSGHMDTLTKVVREIYALGMSQSDKSSADSFPVS